ncbi:EAL domain-containing protein [Belnapia rosea]|uniref:EAL domain, c-di-GMP-specific phosphodiesterase class I (Or its enzymatically inactive variant) n=1 Tax=Belnapia rosea TaxID=938405 RepID=A0A1G6PVZ9_9PROT|nr:EAL domain-containing protein [Belnapia rosea]SDB57644.1 EAL domain, c-di-GMP-specific phosphodiesterase class I (or its enzymatically inactive variant) [Belnapia rosea]SDC84289.1 EAL domain, c-di-GMP-specific phosphodiesterase class I (or its enzymatically inactive variant) [Belnapia rosea]
MIVDGAEVSAPATPRQGVDRERFLTFALAAAELLVEVTPEGRIGFAAGAFRSRLGQPPEAWIGRPVRDLVALNDRASFDANFNLLLARDRMPPTGFRLNDRAATPVSIGALRRPGPQQSAICFSIATTPQPPARPAVSDSAEFSRALAAEATIGGDTTSLGLIEIRAEGILPDATTALIREGLAEALPPTSQAGDFGEGRFGLLGEAAAAEELARQLESLLRGAGHAASVATTSLSIEAPGLTPLQATRALRYALSAFNRGGITAVEEAGFDKGLNGFIAHAYARAAGLRQAIAENRFRLAFQPIVDLSGGGAHHYEALLRPEPGKGEAPLNPQQFVLLAEALDLSAELDWAVLRSVCSAARLTRDTCIAANISGHSLQSPSFREALLAMLDTEPMLVERLLLEITETAEIEDEAEATRSVAALRSRGLPLCIDDFGAGAATFRYLRLLRVDYVKIDGAYVTHAHRSEKDRAIIASMVDLAHGLGAQVVAEQIETEAEAAMMRELGVEYGQGWHFGKPGPLPGRG